MNWLLVWLVVPGGSARPAPFYQNIQGESRLNTHRIIEITEHNGEKVYKTKGDNNYDPDEELKTADQIVAIYTGAKIPVVGRFFNFIRTQLGFFLCILLPMIIFYLFAQKHIIGGLTSGAVKG